MQLVNVNKEMKLSDLQAVAQTTSRRNFIYSAAQSASFTRKQLLTVLDKCQFLNNKTHKLVSYKSKSNASAFNSIKSEAAKLYDFAIVESTETQVISCEALKK